LETKKKSWKSNQEVFSIGRQKNKLSAKFTLQKQNKKNFVETVVKRVDDLLLKTD
jgi:hypothetical protein